MFIRLHQGAQKGNAANYWSLFEPHYKQNTYANPKRTAKSFVLLIGCIQSVICSIFFQKSFLSRCRFPFLSKNIQTAFNSIDTGRMEKFQRQGPQNFHWKTPAKFASPGVFRVFGGFSGEKEVWKSGLLQVSPQSRRRLAELGCHEVPFYDF